MNKGNEISILLTSYDGICEQLKKFNLLHTDIHRELYLLCKDINKLVGTQVFYRNSPDADYDIDCSQYVYQPNSFVFDDSDTNKIYDGEIVRHYENICQILANYDMIGNSLHLDLYTYCIEIENRILENNNTTHFPPVLSESIYKYIIDDDTHKGSFVIKGVSLFCIGFAIGKILTYI